MLRRFLYILFAAMLFGVMFTWNPALITEKRQVRVNLAVDPSTVSKNLPLGPYLFVDTIEPKPWLGGAYEIRIPSTALSDIAIIGLKGDSLVKRVTLIHENTANRRLHELEGTLKYQEVKRGPLNLQPGELFFTLRLEVHGTWRPQLSSQIMILARQAETIQQSQL